MDRRSFIGGALAAGFAARSLQAWAARPIAVALAAGPEARWAVGNTAFPLVTTQFIDRQANSLNSRKLCHAPPGSGLSAVALGFPGFGVEREEQDLPAPYRVTASVEYPLGSPPKRVLFRGEASAVVTPGSTVLRSDPLPVTIPAGATFAVKVHAAWQGAFWLSVWTAAHAPGEWTARGRDLPDHTLDTEPQAATNPAVGFGPFVYAALDRPVPVVGVLGDSIGVSASDWPDPATGNASWGRAMRGVLPCLNLSKGGDTFRGYLARGAGRDRALDGAISDLILEYGSNDLFGGTPPDRLREELRQASAPFLKRGVRCYAVTILPRSLSADGWSGAKGQRLRNPKAEPVRVAYNDWLRGHWRELGLSGIFDIAHAIDPRDSGLWWYDGGLVGAPRRVAAGFATLAGGGVSAVAPARYSGAASTGEGYRPGSRFGCIVQAYPGTQGGGARVSAEAGPDGGIDRYGVVAPGAGYTYPPMVGVPGPWTGDGIHPNARGFDEMIVRADIGPHAFLR